jgi:hypothetical protein
MPTDYHAVVTGDTISGRIPIDHPEHPRGHVDVTPPVLYFELGDGETHSSAALAVAAAIEDEHYARRTHPIQLAHDAAHDPEQYPDATEEFKAYHRAALAELDTRMGGK